MNAGITPYVFRDELVRVHQDENGDPWFVAKDVCRVLGIVKHDQAYSRLEDDERGTYTIGTPSGDQQMVFVNEPGLYSLILTSRKPEAKAFKRWLVHEVLPAIRKTGRYEAPTVEERDRDLETQVESLKVLARGIPLRASHRVQMMNVALQISKAEGTTHEVDVLGRYISLCETVSGRAAVTVSTADEELVRQFVDECCEPSEDSDVVEASSLYQAYCAWCAGKGHKARSVIWFGRQIGKYFDRFKRSTMHYRGTRLLN